jgi:hypothetical protein
MLVLHLCSTVVRLEPADVMRVTRIRAQICPESQCAMPVERVVPSKSVFGGWLLVSKFIRDKSVHVSQNNPCCSFLVCALTLAPETLAMQGMIM